MNYADLTVVHIRAARALLGWSQGDLAEAAGIATSTTKRLESASGAWDKADTSTRQSVFNAFADAGIAFFGDGKPGVRLINTPPSASEDRQNG